MADTVFNACNFQLVVYTISVLICIIPYQLVLGWTLPAVVEQWTLYTLVIVFSILHFYYGFAVVSEMCQHFGIKCFTVCARRANNGSAFFVSSLHIFIPYTWSQTTWCSLNALSRFYTDKTQTAGESAAGKYWKLEEHTAWRCLIISYTRSVHGGSSRWKKKQPSVWKWRQ